MHRLVNLWLVSCPHAGSDSLEINQKKVSFQVLTSFRRQICGITRVRVIKIKTRWVLDASAGPTGAFVGLQ